MQTANGLVKISPDHIQPVYQCTPAEAVVLHKLHFSGAKGNPLMDFTVLPQTATVEVGSKREAAKRPNLEGDLVNVEIRVPILRARTNQEELVRLRRAYFGTVKGQDGKSAPVVNVCFPGSVAQLPQTFEELEGVLEGVNPGFFKQQPKLQVDLTRVPEAGTGHSELEAKRAELLEHTRGELVELAKGLGLEVAALRKKAEIVAAILDASQAAAGA